MSEKSQEHMLFVGARAALIGGVIVGAVIIGMQLLIGRVYSGSEARALIVAMSSPVSTLSTTIIGGLATITALMLTMLSISHTLQEKLSRAFYKRIQRIVLVSIVDMVTAIVLLLILSSPIQKASQQAQQAGSLAATLTYYLLIAMTALVAGLFVSIVIMLYNAVQTVIEAVRPGAESSGD
jgi:hypothetical protein